MLLILVTISLVTALWYAHRRFINWIRFWEKRGIPSLKWSFPFGSKPNALNSRIFDGFNLQETYNNLAPHPFGGVYLFFGPVLFLRDPEMIERILVKDFSYFRNRLQLKNELKGITNQHLFLLEGDLWRALRIKLTPTFTSNRMKGMFDIFTQCSEKLLERIEKETRLHRDSIDAKDLTSRFTLDIIMSCAFGLESHALDDQESKFREIGPYIFPKEVTLIQIISRIVEIFFPRLSGIFPKFIPEHVEKFIFNSIANTIEYREKNGVNRNDFLNLMIELKNRGTVHVDHLDAEEDKFLKIDHEGPDEIEVDLSLLVSQCFIFYAAGFETSSSVQSFALYELAVHQNIQDKLRDEIRGVLKTQNGPVTYQAVLQMKYLDQVIKETLRKYPTLPSVSRVCVKDYKVPNTDFTIEKGTVVVVPIYALHHDGRLFPDPETFDPERFSDENVSKVKHCTYLPFGEGPRMCIGMRFGMLQTKLGLLTILSKYRVELDDKTPVPLQFSTAPLTASKHPILLKFLEP